jgi:hypothetical protein
MVKYSKTGDKIERIIYEIQPATDLGFIIPAGNIFYGPVIEIIGWLEY